MLKGSFHLLRDGVTKMRRMVIGTLSLLLAACGAGETASVAAVEGKAKADEAAAGKQLEAQTQAQVEQSLAADRKRLLAAEQTGR